MDDQNAFVDALEKEQAAFYAAKEAADAHVTGLDANTASMTRFTGAISIAIKDMNAFMSMNFGQAYAEATGQVQHSYSLSGLGGPSNPYTSANMPHMAEGGVVTRPTLAQIGESGPEAVIPLSKKGSMGGGGDTHVHIHNPVVKNDGDIDKIVSQVSRALGKQFALKTGRSPG